MRPQYERYFHVNWRRKDFRPEVVGGDCVKTEPPLPSEPLVMEWTCNQTIESGSCEEVNVGDCGRTQGIKTYLL